ncbi:MAG TPA: hypothetical protein VHO48_09960 [Anaerolineaceae bacterium]|nr:hypothetical protein [Anaerolineaceae bacterium]
MTSDQAETLILVAKQLYLALRIVVLIGWMSFGALVFLSYKAGRKA